MSVMDGWRDGLVIVESIHSLNMSRKKTNIMMLMITIFESLLGNNS